MPRQCWCKCFSKQPSFLLSNWIKHMKGGNQGRQHDASTFWKQALSFLNGILFQFWLLGCSVLHEEWLHHIRAHLSSLQLEMNNTSWVHKVWFWLCASEKVGCPLKTCLIAERVLTLFDILHGLHDWTKLKFPHHQPGETGGALAPAGEVVLRVSSAT